MRLLTLKTLWAERGCCFTVHLLRKGHLLIWALLKPWASENGVPVVLRFSYTAKLLSVLQAPPARYRLLALLELRYEGEAEETFAAGAERGARCDYYPFFEEP